MERENLSDPQSPGSATRAKGFESHRLTKGEIKRFLAIYLEASMDGDKLPDVDGGQYVKEVERHG